MENELLEIADAEDILIVDRKLNNAASMCIVDENQQCLICIDSSKLHGEADAKVKLAHELGHCVSGAFYNIYSPLDLRSRHEHKADSWAFQKLVSHEKLDAAVLKGNTEMWELAEFFDIPQDYMEKIVRYYNNIE